MKNERGNGLPMEVQEIALRERVGKEYPLLYTDSFLLVDTQTARLGIDDITYRAREPIQEDIDMLNLSCRGWIEIYDARDLTSAFAEKMRRLLSVINSKRSVFIFPGNGAKVVKDLLPDEVANDLVTVTLPTQRRVGVKGSVDEVVVSDVTKVRKMVADTKAETLIVLDDVIVTGATLTAIKGAIPGRGIEWFAGSLLMRSPIQRGQKVDSQSGIDGYSAIIVPVVYQGTTGTPANNSLSTLIGNSEKSIAVRSKYMMDYVEDEETFLEAIQQLQQKVVL